MSAMTTMIKAMTEENKHTEVSDYSSPHELVLEVLANTDLDKEAATLVAFLLWTTDATYDQVKNTTVINMPGGTEYLLHQGFCH